MNKEVKLDTRFRIHLNYIIDKGVSSQIGIKGVVNMDDNYTLDINGFTRTVGDGITLTTDTIIIDIREDDYDVGTSVGYLVSDSRQLGFYKRIKITIVCYEPVNY